MAAKTPAIRRPAGLVGWVVLALGVIGAFASCLLQARSYASYTVFGLNPLFVDWLHNWAAVSRAFSGRALYAPLQLAGPYVDNQTMLVGYLYPPSSILLLAPFTGAPFGLLAWIVLNVGLLVTGLAAALQREVGRHWVLGLGLALLLLAPQEPFTEGVTVGNMNVAIAGLLAWAWALGPRSRLIGVLAGVAGTVKVVPGALVFWGIRGRGWRPLVETGVTVLVLAALALPLAGIGTWRDYLTTVANDRALCAPIPSVACLFTPAAGVAGGKVLATVVAALLALAATRVGNEYVAFALVVLAMLAPVPDVHTHFMLWLDVVLIVGLARTAGRWARARTAPG